MPQVKGEAMSLHMIANRANGLWVSKHKWSPPTVLDSAMLKSGQVDVGMYEQLVPQLLLQGKVSFVCQLGSCTSSW